MGEWSTMSFADAVSVNPPVALIRGKVYPFVEMAAVDPSTRSVCESEHREFTGGGSRFSPGDTLMARITPCLENGKIARFLPRIDGGTGFGSTEFIVIRGREGVTTDDYAYYLTMWPDFRQFAIGQMTGSSGRQRVPAETLAGFEVPLPPLPTQRRIAHILGTLDDKIELNRRMNRTLEKMAAAIFKSWFIDFDPVWRNAARDRNQPSPPSPLPMGEGWPTGRGEGCVEAFDAMFPDTFEDSVLGQIPKGWKVGSLGDVADSPRRGVKPSDVPPATPYIGLEHMPRRCIAQDAWGRAEDVASGKSQFKQGEILFGKLRPYFHKVGIAPMDGVCSTDIVVVTPKSQDWHGYVLSLVSSKAFVDYTDSHSAGTKMPRTNWKDMNRYPLALPPLSVAKAFQIHVADMHRRIMLNVRQNRRLAGVRDAMLPKLMCGEIEAPDVEQAAGRAV